MAFSAKSLKANISSLAPLPGLYAAWLTLIASLTLSKTLCTTATAKIFLSTERRIIGRRLLQGPWGFLGLGRGSKCPFLFLWDNCQFQLLYLKLMLFVHELLGELL